MLLPGLVRIGLPYPPDDPAVTTARYAAQVERLQAQDWLSLGQEE